MTQIWDEQKEEQLSKTNWNAYGKEQPAIIPRRKSGKSHLLMRSLSRKQTYYIQVIKRNRKLHRVETRRTKKKEINIVEIKQAIKENKTEAEIKPVSQADAVTKIAPKQKEAKSNGRELDSSVKQAAELSFVEEETETIQVATPAPDELQLLKEYIEEHNIKNKCEEDLDAFNSPLGRLWLLEFHTMKKQKKYKGCVCQLSDGIIYVDSFSDQWLLRYSELFNRMILYHKNKKSYRINTDREPIRGYHVQHIQPLLTLQTDEMYELKKPQPKEGRLFQNYKGKPTIKDYLNYICQHRELTETRNKRQKRRSKDLRNVLKDRNVSYAAKQKKRKKLREELNHEMARDVLHLLDMLRTGTNGG
jgi:hypothetical protein